MIKHTKISIFSVKKQQLNRSIIVCMLNKVMEPSLCRFFVFPLWLNTPFFIIIFLLILFNATVLFVFNLFSL